jgi:hypothetical protein
MTAANQAAAAQFLRKPFRQCGVASEAKAQGVGQLMDIARGSLSMV